GCPIELFAQREGFFFEQILVSLAIVYIGACCIPANNVSVLVPERLVMRDEPTVSPILAAQSHFQLKGLSGFETVPVFLTQALAVFGMNKSAAALFGIHVFDAETGVSADRLIDIQDLALRTESSDQLRDTINDLSELDLTAPEFLFSVLSIVNIGEQV